MKSIAGVSKGLKSIPVFFLAMCLASPSPQAWAQAREKDVSPEDSFLACWNDTGEGAFAGEGSCVRDEDFDDAGQEDGESPDGSSDPADPVKPADPADPPDGSGDAGGPEAPADGSAGPAPAEAPAGPAAPAPAEPPAPAAALPENDSPDGSAYRGVTLRRTDLYASPDDSQAPADFFWGGVVLSGFSRWDAAGGWLAVAYAGQTLFAKASDVSLNDAPGRDAPYVGRTLGRVSMYPAPDLSSEPFDFFWGGVEVPAAPWDAAGEWVLSSYRGQAAFLPADSVELLPRYYRQEGTTMYLDIEWAGQPNGYYCGPASGYMVLNHLGARTSENGAPLTMDNLARYMGVDSSGADSTGFRNALNNWLGWSAYQTIASPSYDQVRDAVMGAFSTGYPTVVHTYERRGGPHYNGHGNSSMGHFMVVDGYDTATDAVYIADPWAGVWSASSQKFWYPSLREFTATYITPYRYVYFR